MVMPIVHERHAVDGDAEIFGNILKFGFRDLRVGVDNELPFNGFEHARSPSS
jgi:hypothetical protein